MDSGWISVLDRLPDKQGYYLCYCPKALLRNRQRVYKFATGFWWTMAVPSHWMYLPDEPKG